LKEVAVSSDPHAPRSLSARPNLDQQRKLARELLRGVQSRDPSALQRLRERHPRFAGHSDERIASEAALHDAQLALAREYGFASWAALKRHIEGQQALRRTRIFVGDRSYYEDRAAGLVSAHAAGVPHALEQIREWHPAYATATDDEIRRASFDIDAARLVYARQHGFASWTALDAHVRAVAAGERHEPFKDAFDAMRAQDFSRLTQILDRHPELLRARGTNGNTLLQLAVSLAGNACRPLTSQAAQLLDRFISGGAAINEPNDRGWTPLHQAAYANQVEIARRLIERGAALDLEAHGEGGTPLAVALFWGHREVADLLAEHAIIPGNLRVAAGLGRADLIAACFAPDGTLTVAARSGRGFYRPHSGFPVWRPSDDRQEILDEALVWASKADRVEALPLLVARGANVNADPYRGTPLIWAAFKGRTAAARWLLDHGARIGPATFGGPSHGEGITALHIAAQNNDVDMARLLIAHGADTSIEDALYHSSPRGWATHFGSTAVLDVLPSEP
jgi:ankyrin repeat protein